MINETKAAKKAICQSCGMPLYNEDDFGTNADNSKNEEYCVYCCQKGQFTDPDITMEEMITKIAGNTCISI